MLGFARLARASLIVRPWKLDLAVLFRNSWIAVLRSIQWQHALLRDFPDLFRTQSG